MDGCAISPAASAVREGYSTSHIDFDFGLSMSLPGAYGNVDFFNRGPNTNRETTAKTSRFFAVSAGFQLQIGELGLSSTLANEQFSLSAPSKGKPGLDLNFSRITTQAAYGFLGNQLVIGAGLRSVAVNINATESDRVAATPLLTLSGSGASVAVIVKPDDRPFRLSAVYRSPVTAQATEGASSLFAASTAERDYVLPSRVVAPWELEVGAAVQLGPRPLNPAWRDPSARQAERKAVVDARRKQRKQTGISAADEARLEGWEDEELAFYASADKERERTRYLNHPRKYVLLLASALVVGASPNAINLVGFVDQQKETAGARATVSPRFGVEAEPIANLAKVRAGTYYEPSRFDGVAGRQHFTLGGDLFLFTSPKLGFIPALPIAAVGFVDVAPRYQNVGLFVGFWK